ncbi:MAG: metallophosphoesterase family protein [Bacteroidota bacterium]
MTRIGLLSDTHGFLDEAVLRHFASVDQIWHAGDVGTPEILDRLAAIKPIRGVYGNIDGPTVRARFPEANCFYCEEVKVGMLHIAGYPSRYNANAKSLIRREKPQLFIAGHSHILKIMYDRELEHLHINPGAAGQQGWHQEKTLVRFTIDGKDIRDCEVIELGKRGAQ